MKYLIKILISALIIFFVSELGKKYAPIAAILASLPLVSIIAMIWLYNDTGDVQKIIDLSYSIFLAVLPSLVFFILLPFLLKKGLGFPPAMLISCVGMFLSYSAYIYLMARFGIKI